ncbi:MAG: portal protein, partial [Brevundimonas sp.]
RLDGMKEYDSDASKPDALKDALEAFEKSAEHDDHNRKAFEDDIDFALLENQWPDQVRRDRELEGRPCLTVNKLAAMGRQIVNDARRNKPGITVHPVDSEADPETAEVLNGIIRNIEQSSNAEVAYDTALENAVFGGFGYFRINTKYTSDDTFDQDIVIERISNPLSVYRDCYSTAADSSDWNYCFVVDSLSKAQFKRQYPGAEQVDWKSEAWRDLSSPWLDGDFVQVAEYWTREKAKKRILLLSDQSVIEADEYEKNKPAFDAVGIQVMAEREVDTHKVKQRIMSGAEVLETVDWAGKYIPIVPVYGTEVVLKGKRTFRSLVRGAKDAQRMFNYWRTTSTELVAMAPKTPFIGRKGAFETDINKWATANTQSHAFIEYDGPEAPQRQPFAGVPAGALQEALNASDDIKTVLGMYDASLGARSNETSGKAIIARQMESDNATFHFIDNLSRGIRHAGRILIDLIPQVYSVPRVLRIIGQDGEPDMRPVNQEIRTEERNPLTGEIEEIVKIYDLTAGRYDLTVSAGPSFASMRQEAASQMIELIRAYPDAAPIIGDLLVKNLDWPGADEIAERMQKAMGMAEEGEGAPQGPDPQAMQVVQRYQSALQEMQQRYQALEADKSLEARKLDIAAFDAETKRMSAMNRETRLPAGLYNTD